MIMYINNYNRCIRQKPNRRDISLQLYSHFPKYVNLSVYCKTFQISQCLSKCQHNDEQGTNVAHNIMGGLQIIAMFHL